MKVLVCSESRDGRLDRLFFEMLTAARAAAGSGEVVALWLGADSEPARSQMGRADRVVAALNERLSSATADLYAEILLQAIETEKPDLIMVGYTANGLDYGPEVSARTGLPMAASVVGLEPVGDRVALFSQLYGGKLIARLDVPGSALAMISPGGFPESPAAEIDPSRITTFDASRALSANRLQLIEESTPSQSDVDLTTADRIVCVGRGIGDQSNVELAQELSRRLGAEIAGSRPVADNGWLPKQRQVGKSGQKVRPKLYLALGVSGAPEHLEGMSQSELIVAVNTDLNAPIFNVAHLVANCDLFDFIDCLTEQLDEIRTA
jgi:electron transfer flavoprotein alpha subunit